jgi:hypothetical protein
MRGHNPLTTAIVEEHLPKGRKRYQVRLVWESGIATIAKGLLPGESTAITSRCKQALADRERWIIALMKGGE